MPVSPTTTLVVSQLRTWAVPGLAGITIVTSAVLSGAEVASTATTLTSAIIATLVLLVYLAERPLLEPGARPRDRLLGAGLGALWLTACYVPFHTRIFPGHPLLDGAQVNAGGQGLPLTIPASGHRRLDLLLEGKLAVNSSGGAATSMNYHLTLTTPSGTLPPLTGLFDDRLKTQRLGRRGTAVVHQTHSSDLRVIDNPGQQDVTVTQVDLEPPSEQGITISVFAHPLPGPLVLGLAGAVLLAITIVFDRRGPVAETDGALTLSTAAAFGTAYIFWTSNAVRPDFHTLIGSAILGGALGFIAGAAVWWVAKRLIVRPEH